jgi:hypothetical protein
MNLPYGGFPGTPGAAIQVAPGIVQERAPLTTLLLSLVTCGIYGLYWQFKTSDELRAATGDDSINPLLELLLTLVTVGIWGVYVMYRNAQKIHRVLASRDPSRNDPSQTILILAIAGYFVLVTQLMALWLLQEEMNQLARTTR